MCIKIKKYSFEFIRLQSFVTKTPHSNQLPAATVNYTKTKCFVFGSLRKNIWKLVGFCTWETLFAPLTWKTCKSVIQIVLQIKEWRNEQE